MIEYLIMRLLGKLKHHQADGVGFVDENLRIL